MSFYQAKRYPSFLMKSKNQHGVHSPFVFELLHEVFSSDKEFYAFADVQRARKRLLQDNTVIEVTDFGAGSHQMKGNERKICDIAKHSLTNKKQSEILFRIVNKFQPKNILELGTSLGIMTSYFSLSCPDSTITTLEGCPRISEKAKDLFEKMSLKNIELVSGNIDQTLVEVLKDISTVDFAFVDGNHRKEPTIEYTNLIIEKSNNDTIIVLDDIYWSSGMEEAWKELINHPKVTLSIDIFHKGFLFFRKGMEKQHFLLRV